MRDADRQRTVQAVTDLFRAGEINCLVGTASLLGEGWDAPALNTLVLASVVGSFVMSNQMRGRAFRVDPADPDKAANIWHLATLTPAREDLPPSPAGTPEPDDGGSDFEALRRRFDAFAGIGLAARGEDGRPLIENGLARLGCDPPPRPVEETVTAANAAACRRAGDRHLIRKLWLNAIAPRREGRFLRPVRTIAAPASIVRIRFSAALGKRDTGLRARLRRWLQSRRLRRIAEAVIEGMCDRLDIEPEAISRRRPRVSHSGKSIHVSLPGAPEEVQACLVRSLAEFYDLFDNPRWLLRSDRGWYAVPDIFAARREQAEIFSRHVRRAIGRHDLVFAHGDTGAAALLEARQDRLLGYRDFRTSALVRWEA